MWVMYFAYKSNLSKFVILQVVLEILTVKHYQLKRTGQIAGMLMS